MTPARRYAPPTSHDIHLSRPSMWAFRWAEIPKRLTYQYVMVICLPITALRTATARTDLPGCIRHRMHLQA